MKILNVIALLLLVTLCHAQHKADSVAKPDYGDDWANLHHYAAENNTLSSATVN